MTMGLQIRETMSGWLQLDNMASQQSFAFSLRAFTPKIFSFTVPRPFHGTVQLAGGEYPCEGELTLFPGGPHYWLEFDHPELGRLHIEGRKTYRLKQLAHSMTTCPLDVFQESRKIGRAEVAYQDSMLAFPFTALRLVREENAFSDSPGGA